MIISTDGEKAFGKIQHHFVTKILRKLRQEGKSLNIMNDIDEKPIDNIILSGERQKAFSLRFGTRQGCLLSDSVLEAPVRAIRQEKENAPKLEKRKTISFTDDTILPIERKIPNNSSKKGQNIGANQ